MKLTLFIPLLCLLFTFCKKEDPITPPPASTTGQAPTITITGPASNSHYNLNDVITITANISDDQEIFTLIVDVVNLGDNSVEHIKNNHIHLANYSLTSSYTVTNAAPGNYQIVIIATDLDGRTTQSTLNFSIN